MRNLTQEALKSKIFTFETLRDFVPSPYPYDLVPNPCLGISNNYILASYYCAQNQQKRLWWGVMWDSGVDPDQCSGSYKCRSQKDIYRVLASYQITNQEVKSI